MTESKCGSASRILQKNATQLACSMLSLTQKKKHLQCLFPALYLHGKAARRRRRFTERALFVRHMLVIISDKPTEAF